MSATWEVALDSFAARLADQRAVLQHSGPVAVAPFAPPPSLGPLPVALRARAEALLQEATEVEAQLHTALTATGRDMRVVRRLMASGPAAATPRYLDQAL